MNFPTRTRHAILNDIREVVGLPRLSRREHLARWYRDSELYVFWTPYIACCVLVLAGIALALRILP